MEYSFPKNSISYSNINNNIYTYNNIQIKIIDNEKLFFYHSYNDGGYYHNNLTCKDFIIKRYLLTIIINNNYIDIHFKNHDSFFNFVKWFNENVLKK